MLGFASAQRLHSALAATDVKTGLVEDIARVTKRNLWDFFPEQFRPSGAVATDASIAVVGSSNNITELPQKFLDLLEKKDEQINRLLSIIESLSKTSHE